MGQAAALHVGRSLGYHALKELGALLLLGYSFLPTLYAIALVLIDTSAFTQPTTLFSSAYTANLALAAHPGVAAAPVAYGALLAIVHVWELFWAVCMALATWHMWHCGVRSGHARHMLASPDTKAATVVSFARPAAPDESSKGAALPMNFDDFVPASTSAPAPTTAV